MMKVSILNFGRTGCNVQQKHIYEGNVVKYTLPLEEIVKKGIYHNHNSPHNR